MVNNSLWGVIFLRNHNTQRSLRASIRLAAKKQQAKLLKPMVERRQNNGLAPATSGSRTQPWHFPWWNLFLSQWHCQWLSAGDCHKSASKAMKQLQKPVILHQERETTIKYRQRKNMAKYGMLKTILKGQISTIFSEMCLGITKGVIVLWQGCNPLYSIFFISFLNVFIYSGVTNSLLFVMLYYFWYVLYVYGQIRFWRNEIN